MMEASLPLYNVDPRSSRGIMDEEDDDELGTPSSSSSSSSSCCDSGASDDGSSPSELADDASSEVGRQPYEMTSLMAELPFKLFPSSRRGLSRHFHGKSQSFTSLATARCLQDLVKPERPYTRKKLMKSSRSYVAGLDTPKPRSPTLHGCSKAISKRPPTGTRGNGRAAGVAGRKETRPCG